MKQRFIPMLYSTPMVQALLDGRKTQTRRVVKPQPEKNGAFWELGAAAWSTAGPVTPVIGHSLYNRMPYKPGDILWVRETWCEPNLHDGYEADYYYKATLPVDREAGYIAGVKWKPSIFMPKAACRLFLKVTDVRLERLQDISEADAKAEGVEIWNQVYKNYFPSARVSLIWAYELAVLSYKSLWQSINGVDSWTANPWVWVVMFEVVEKPDGFN